MCVLRGVVDFSCPGGQVEAFRGVSEAFGGHFGAQNTFKAIEKHRFFNGFWKTAFSITRVVQVSFGAGLWSLFGALVALLGPSWGGLVALFGVLWALRGLLLGRVWGRVWCLLVRWWRLGYVPGVFSLVFCVAGAK